MPNYSFNILVAANSKEEAEAKLELLLQMGAFCSDYDVHNLAVAFFKYWSLNFVYKLPVNNRNETQTAESRNRPRGK